MNLMILLHSKEGVVLIFLLVLFVFTMGVFMLYFTIKRAVDRRHLSKDKSLCGKLKVQDKQEKIVDVLNEFRDNPSEIYNCSDYASASKITRAIRFTILPFRMDVLVRFLVHDDQRIRKVAAQELERGQWIPQNEHEKMALCIANGNFSDPLLNRLKTALFVPLGVINEPEEQSRMITMTNYHQRKKSADEILSGLRGYFLLQNIAVYTHMDPAVDAVLNIRSSLTRTHDYKTQDGSLLGNGYTQYFHILVNHAASSKPITGSFIQVRPPDKYVSPNRSFVNIIGSELSAKQITEAGASILAAVYASKLRKTLSLFPA
jgi:hypothetical protein